MTIKQTTSTNILRGIVYFLTAVSDNTKAQPIAPVVSMINNLSSPCDIFRAADALRVPASKLLAITEWFEVGMVVNGWEVSRGSDDDSDQDPFLLAVHTLLSSEYQKEAAAHARLSQVMPLVHAPFESSFRNVLINHLYAYIVNKTPMETVKNMARTALYQHPMMGAQSMFGSVGYGSYHGGQTPWAHRPIQGD